MTTQPAAISLMQPRIGRPHASIEGVRFMMLAMFDDLYGVRLQVVVLLNNTPVTEYSFASGVFKTT